MLRKIIIIFLLSLFIVPPAIPEEPVKKPLSLIDTFYMFNLLFLRKGCRQIKPVKNDIPFRDFNQSITTIRASLINFTTFYAKDPLPAQLNCNRDFYSFCYSYAIINMSSNDLEILERSFKKIFGVALISKKIEINTGNKERHPYFIFYNPSGLLAAFDKIYIKPDTIVFKTGAQEVYNKLFKKYLREKTLKIKKILSHPEKLEKLSAVYYKKATTTVFNARQYLNSHIGKFGLKRNSMDDRLFGMIVRRKIDKSLPVVIRIINRIIRDYDPEFYNDNKLQGPGNRPPGINSRLTP
jgi:hypothetical protein